MGCVGVYVGLFWLFYRVFSEFGSWGFYVKIKDRRGKEGLSSGRIEELGEWI